MFHVSIGHRTVLGTCVFFRPTGGKVSEEEEKKEVTGEEEQKGEGTGTLGLPGLKEREFEYVEQIEVPKGDEKP